MITKINKISLAILIAIGLQFFIVGGFTMRFIDFSGFSIINWILELLYLTFSISFALRTDL
jgi:small neutral amino acid transporter SnatA (MarC family)